MSRSKVVDDKTDLEKIKDDIKTLAEYFNKSLVSMEEAVTKANNKVTQTGEGVIDEFKPKEYFKKVAEIWEQYTTEINNILNSPAIKDITPTMRNQLVQNMVKVTSQVRNNGEQIKFIINNQDKRDRIRATWLQTVPQYMEEIVAGCREVEKYNQEQDEAQKINMLSPSERAKSMHDIVRKALGEFPVLAPINDKFNKSAKVGYNDITLSPDTYMQIYKTFKEITNTNDKRSEHKDDKLAPHILKRISNIKADMNKHLSMRRRLMSFFEKLFNRNKQSELVETRKRQNAGIVR